MCHVWKYGTIDLAVYQPAVCLLIISALVLSLKTGVVFFRKTGCKFKLTSRRLYWRDRPHTEEEF